MEAQPPFWTRLLPLGDRKRLMGLSFIVAVAVIWVAASFVVQGIEEQGAHPAVLTLVANSLFAVYVPIYHLNLHWRRRRKQVAAAAHVQESTALVPAHELCSDEGDTAPLPLALEDSHNGKASTLLAPPMCLKQLFRAALVVAPLWYVAQLTFNMSLAKTSVTSNTILSSTSALFTFLFAVALLSETFSLWKLGFVLLLIVGTAMVTLADGKYSEDKSAAKQNVAGDMLCLLSAIVYGAYTVSIRKLLQEDDNTPMTMFFGFMGLLIFLSVGPLLLVLWLVGVGLGTLTWRVLGLMVAKGLLDNVLSDYLWARAILLMGPTIATSGLALQVPLAVVLDAVLRSPAWRRHTGSTVLTLLGGAVVLCGFFGVNAAGEDDEKTRHAMWEERQEALQRELDFDLEDPEEGVGGLVRQGAQGMPPAGRTHDSPAMEQALQLELQFDESPQDEGHQASFSSSTQAANGGCVVTNGSSAAANGHHIEPNRPDKSVLAASGKLD